MKAIICFIGLTLAGCAGGPAVSPTRPQAVRVVAPRAGPVVEGRTYLGDLVSDQRVRVLAQVPGTVLGFEVEEGAHVVAGDPVARIAAPDVAARLERVRAERGRTQAERDFACSQRDTDRLLVASGDLPEVQEAKSELACASAEKAVEAARAAEREAAVAGGRAVERAPFAGVVLAHLVDPGQTVMPGTPLVMFGSEASVLRVRVPQHAAAAFPVGTRVDTELGPGRVHGIAPQAVGPARLIELEVAFDAPIEATRTGTSWAVTMVVDERTEAVAVPEGAVGIDAEGSFVYLVEGDQLRRHDVQPGPRDDGWVAVTPAPPVDGWVVCCAVGSLDPARPVLAVKP